MASMDTLSKEHVDAYQDLLQRAAELASWLDGSKNQEEVKLTDVSDKAARLMAVETTSIVNEVLRMRISQIQKALRRMSDGTYALCEKCGYPIHPARLKANPEGTLCLACQERMEQRSNGRRVTRYR